MELLKKIKTPQNILIKIKEKLPSQRQLTKFVEKGLTRKRNRKTKTSRPQAKRTRLNLWQYAFNKLEQEEKSCAGGQ